VRGNAHDRLRAAEVKLKAHVERATELATLRAENARLREALEKWINARDARREFEIYNPDNSTKVWARLLDAEVDAETTARAALAPQEPGHASDV
jgi:hypothetical protein